MEIKGKENPIRSVFHYTKLSSAVSIITQEGVIFRAGRYDSMNDPSDSVYGALETVKSLGEEMAYVLADPNTYNFSPYLVSFCKEDDQPLMWRLYNAEVTLHIDSEILRSHCKNSKRMLMDEVVYLPQKEVCKKVLELFSEANSYFNKKELEFAAKAKTSFIKCEDFACEQEWRVAWFDDYTTVDDNEDPKKLEGDIIASEIKVHGTKYGGISYYRDFRFPKDCLSGITIRAHSDEKFNLIRSQLRIWLAHCGYDVKKVKIEKTKTQRVR